MKLYGCERAPERPIAWTSSAPLQAFVVSEVAQKGIDGTGRVEYLETDPSRLCRRARSVRQVSVLDDNVLNALVQRPCAAPKRGVWSAIPVYRFSFLIMLEMSSG